MAAGLLRSASAADDLIPIAAALGFDPSPIRLDDEARTAFGLDSSFGDVRMVRGPGTLRAIAFVADSDDARAKLTRAATRLVAKAPHALWVILAIEPGTTRVLIAAAIPASRGASVA